MRRPIDRNAEVTGDTRTHGAYGIGPASDYALPRGARVVAPQDMRLTEYRSATGGYSLLGTFSGGSQNFQHLIEGTRRSGFVAEGTPIAQIAGPSDNPGSMWFGPHLHTWVTTDKRRSFEEYIATLGFTSATYKQTATPLLSSTAGELPTPILDEETDNDMAKNSGIYWTDGNGKHINAIVNAGSGFFQPFESTSGGYNSGLARAFETGSFELVSLSHAQAIETACKQVRNGS